MTDLLLVQMLAWVAGMGIGLALHWRRRYCQAVRERDAAFLVAHRFAAEAGRANGQLLAARAQARPISVGITLDAQQLVESLEQLQERFTALPDGRVEPKEPVH